jgi:hypothetical protein
MRIAVFLLVNGLEQNDDPANRAGPPGRYSGSGRICQQAEMSEGWRDAMIEAGKQ